MSVCVHACTYKYMGAGQDQKGAQISWSWTDRRLWATWYGYWVVNFGPLQEQQVILNAEPSFQSTLSEKETLKMC